MSLSAHLFVVLLCAAAPDGGDQPARQTEVVQENKTFHELRHRVNRMRAAQVEIRDATVLLGKKIQANGGQATRADNQSSLMLRDKQQEICQSAEKVIALLDADGSAIAFVEVFRQLHLDMQVAERRLGKTDPGAVTIAIQNDIIETFDEMIDALKSR